MTRRVWASGGEDRARRWRGGPSMQKDGDVMRVHDVEASEDRRGARGLARESLDRDWQAARRAAAVGHVRNVERGAVLHLQRLAGNAGVGSLVDAEAEERSPVLDVVGRGGGSPMPTDVRVQMEERMGAD